MSGHVEMRRSKFKAADGSRGWDVRCEDCTRPGQWELKGLSEKSACDWMVEHALKHDESDS